MGPHASGLARLVLAAVGAAVLAGCATEQLYAGPARGAAGIALIEGDPRINAGLPLTAVIREVDGRVLGLASSRVALEPGRHVLLVDCTMAETRSTTRHELKVEVEAGSRYRLGADSAPGNRSCGAVRLEAR